MTSKLTSTKFSARCATNNASRGTANARHVYYALVIVGTVLCGKLVVALAAP
nr:MULTISPECIES: DUF3265 domain-containing protein [unclassified Salinivibrio]